MLNQKLALHDIRDVEAFCERAIQRSGLTEFGYLDREDLLAECITFVWRLSRDTSTVRSSFSGYAGDKLRRFIVDWKRSDFRTRWVFGDGRVYERRKPEFVAWDAELASTQRGSDVDAPDGGSADLMRALRKRSGRAARRHDPLGEEAHGRAA